MQDLTKITNNKTLISTLENETSLKLKLSALGKNISSTILNNLLENYKITQKQRSFLMKYYIKGRVIDLGIQNN